MNVRQHSLRRAGALSLTGRPTRKTNSAASSQMALDAAALQDHISRKWKITASGPTRRAVAPSRQRRTHTVANAERKPVDTGVNTRRRELPSVHDGSLVDPRFAKWTCEHCIELNVAHADICTGCGTSRPKEVRPRRAVPSLAQRRGLVPAPTPQLTAADWRRVEAQCQARGAHEDPCPICLEPFALREQVLLSCSHTFHRVCLANFERFIGRSHRACPVCRHPNYETAPTRSGSHAYQRQCAIRLQSMWRCVRTQRAYAALRQDAFLRGTGDPWLRRRLFRQRLRAVTEKLRVDSRARADRLDALFAALDASAAEASQAADAAVRNALARRKQRRRRVESEPVGTDAEARTSVEDLAERAIGDSVIVPGTEEIGESDANDGRRVQWSVQLRRAMERSSDCPICLMPLGATVSSGPANVALLSCSHWFHEPCLESLERFVGDHGPHACPVCRVHNYSRRKVDPAVFAETMRKREGCQ